jgi:hypothetical protein
MDGNYGRLDQNGANRDEQISNIGLHFRDERPSFLGIEGSKSVQTSAMSV